MSEKSSEKHPRLKNLGDKAGSNDFKNRQPSSEQKKEGWKKKKFSRTVIRELLESKFELTPKLRKKLEKSFGPLDDKTIGELISMRQIEKAINNADTFATTNLLNQAFGQPKQEVDVTSGGQPIKQNVIKYADGSTEPI